VVLVVGKAHLDAAGGGVADRAGDAVADLAGQADVIEREIQRAARGLDEPDDARRNVLSPLTAVGELDEL
jgi:hypothetical protein